MLPPWPQQFSARVMRSDEKHGIRIYIDGDLERQEDLSGEERTTFSRPGYSWTLNDEERTYYRIKLPKLKGEFHPDSLCVWTMDGAQRIDGRRCLRFVGRYHKPDLGGHEVWFVDARTHMRRRHITFNKAGKKCLVTDYLDVVLGPQDPQLFKVPRGFKRARVWV